MGGNVLDLEQIRKKLADRRLSVVSEKTGIKVKTLRRVLAGGTPRLQVVIALTAYFRADEANNG
jgi:N-acetylmuramic acid 6-phosphate (MurNAc-6-P) etherase